MNPTRRDRANAIRFLTIDAIQQANSGHPGMPMGMADIAEVLWQDFLQHHPSNPQWINRDRFVLSNGHGAMLQYALLHLTGYDLSLSDIKQFRQLHSKTPGHPEFGETPGVETTTGPLGQGLGNAVGMAIAEKHLASEFNRPGFPIIDYFTYCFVGDGCLMEGISHEVCSLAGLFGLGKLIVFYDDNGISIDGEVSAWFKDNTPKRFEAYGWQVIPDVDGHDSDAIRDAITEARAELNKPTLICCKTTIGWGSPRLAGTAETHGAPLGSEEVLAVRHNLNWPHHAFDIPKEIYTAWDARDKGRQQELNWQNTFKNYEQHHPELAKELLRRLGKKLPAHWEFEAKQLIKVMHDKKQPMATRKASQHCLDHLAPLLPELMGGSADLMESNCTNWQSKTVFTAEHPEGRYIHYGVREFGMAAIMNGLALSHAIVPFGGTFLTFSDYARNAIRLAAMMRQRVVYVLTHDSIGLGEDGPTHQPIEHGPSLRLIPNVSVWRPCDSVETAAAWIVALQTNGPTCLLLSRQNLPQEERTLAQMDEVIKGGYVLCDHAIPRLPDAILMATGSEVSIVREAAKLLKEENILVRVVSMPSINIFLDQSKSYQEAVLPPEIKARVFVEAAATGSGACFIGEFGKAIGIDRFGASAKAATVFQECGITVDHVVTATKEMLRTLAQHSSHNIQSLVTEDIL